MIKNSKCTKCGKQLDFVISATMSSEKRGCECGEVHYVDNAPIDWARVAEGEK